MMYAHHERKIRRLTSAAFCGTILLSGCKSRQSEMAAIPFRVLTHSSRQLLISGWCRADVLKRFGPQTETRLGDFIYPRYGVPEVPAGYDEEWIYYYHDNLSHRLVFFESGLVALAVEEWSDW